MSNFCDLFTDPPQDEEGNFSIGSIDPEQRKWYTRKCLADDTTFADFLLLGLIMSVISVLGIFGNALSALVLLKSQFRSSVNFLLLGLTLSDTIVIIYSFASFSLPSIFGYFKFGRGYNYNFFPMISPYFLPIAFIAQTGSIYSCVAITIERYVVVCWPLYAKSWCTNKRARSYTLIVFLFSILINLPRWFELYILEVVLPIPPWQQTTNGSQIQHSCSIIQRTPMRKSDFYKKFYINWTYLIFMYTIPFLILATLNYAIYKRIKIADRRRSTLTTKRESRETSISKMLLSVVIVFLACNFLPMINNALETLFSIDCNTLINFANFFLLFNSCCNFAIYYIFGQKFRTCFIQTWYEIFPCFQRKTGSIPKNSYSTRSIRTETIELVVQSPGPTNNNPNFST